MNTAQRQTLFEKDMKGFKLQFKKNKGEYVSRVTSVAFCAWMSGRASQIEEELKRGIQRGQ